MLVKKMLYLGGPTLKKLKRSLKLNCSPKKSHLANKNCTPAEGWPGLLHLCNKY